MLNSPRKIIHLDADCFFAALEIRENPDLADFPLAVGGDPGRRGVISTCNYLARQYGVHSAMPSAHAKRLCPELVIRSSNFPLYKQVSAQMFEIFTRFSEKIEPLSLDEAFLDVSDCQQFHGSATLIAREIRRQVETELGITVSAGVAPIKFLAKIASDWSKPNGLFTVTPDKVTEFVKDLPLQKLPGVGKVTREKLAREGLLYCRDLESYSEHELVQRFGRFGANLKRMSVGIDEREVKSSRERKSLSIETTFARDISSPGEIADQIDQLVVGLEERYNKLQRKVAVSKKFVKLKFDDFTQTTLESSVSRCGKIFSSQEFERMCYAAWARQKRPLRLLGVGLSFAERSHPQAQLSFPFAN
ncbi:DNA polymerase IV [Teredinibacter turnerae]|uniref:DNA polymerase IV n=1 Tax=Teredinibacter turnerae (strain ATCC 39867 / T7901) TaxID=377629 RepID=C5BNY2_TERTT|nr:DNA polymerase IV [Teredinibacter turnerae]ACR10692.1 DNA polymerase IV [Teredinibacter turnerae T7901]